MLLLICLIHLIQSISSDPSENIDRIKVPILSKIVNYTLEVNYKWMLGKAVIAINGKDIGPTIRVNVGDVLRIKVINSLWKGGITVHWHGLRVPGTPWMDGVPSITQCMIKSGTEMTYEFIADHVGTHWYHAHVEGQRDDAFYGAFIVEDKNHTFEHDEEIIIFLADFHEKYTEELVMYMHERPYRWVGSPDKILINGLPNYNLTVVQGKTYLLRFIGATAHSYINVSISNHNFTIVEVEGTYTNPFNTNHFWINAGERYAMLLKANNPGCYYINVSSMSDPIYSLIRLNYDNVECNGKYLPAINNNYFNTSLVTNKYPVEIPKANKNLILVMSVHKVNGSGTSKVFVFNGIAFQFPSTPLLLSYYENLPIPDDNHTNIINVNLGDVMDIELINIAKFQHVFHLHGHSFWVMNSDNPIIRDSVTIHVDEKVIIRVVFDNPGTFLAHCHSTWHVIMGLAMVFAYPPETIPKPPNNFQICGRTMLQHEESNNLLLLIYLLCTIIAFGAIGLTVSLFFNYKTKKREEERLLMM